MKQTLKKTLGILAFAAIIPVSVWAAGGPAAANKARGPSQQALDACAGKQAGDTVQFTTPRGRTVSATCVDFDGELIARPERQGKDFRRDGKGRWLGEGPCWQGKTGSGIDNCFLADKLNLTPEQKTRIMAIMKEEHQKNAALYEQLRENRKAFREAAMKSPLDEAAVRKVAEEQGKLHAELMVALASGINKAMEILTPEQREKAEKIGFLGHGMGPGHGWGMGPGQGWGQGDGRGAGRGPGRGMGGGPRDGSGPNPDCPLKK